VRTCSYVLPKEANGLTRHDAHHSQSAIAVGAAIRGLFGLKPSSRKCRYHYGIECNMEFRPKLDNEADSYICEWSGKKWCHNRVSWVAKKAS
jgi:hypothetical protein